MAGLGCDVGRIGKNGWFGGEDVEGVGEFLPKLGDVFVEPGWEWGPGGEAVAFGTGDGDVEEAAFVVDGAFVAVGVGNGRFGDDVPDLAAALSFGRKAVAAQAGDEDGGPFHAFGFVDGEDLEGVELGEAFFFPAFGVVAGGLVVEELGKTLVELAGEGFEVDLFVVGDNLAELAKVVEDDFTGTAVDGGDVFFTQLDLFEEVEVEALQEEKGVVFVYEVGFALFEQGESGLDLGSSEAKVAGLQNLGECGFGDGWLVFGGEVGHVEVDRLHGVDFGRVEEFVHAADDVGDACVVEGTGDGGGVVADAAQQDGEVAVGEAAWWFFGIVLVFGFVEVFDLGGNPLGFAVGVGEVEGEDVAIGGVGGLGVCAFHALGESVAVALDDGEGGVNNGRAAAEVFVEANLFDVGVMVGEFDDVADVAAAPLVDGLVVIADNADVVAKLVEELDELLLQWVDVLIFVDDEVLELVGDLLAELGVGLEFLHGFADDEGVVEVALVVQEGVVLGDGGVDLG